jgi:cyclophilin family peptidyl-prolyl cis-trans isomerase
LVDKPGRRKKKNIPWAKIAGVAIAALVVVSAGWLIYNTYIYVPPPSYARVGTSLGYFDVELLPSCAPKTVSNFVSLAQSGFYNNVVWHRIVPGFVIQTGDPNSRNGVNSTRTTWGNGGSNRTVPLEVCSSLHNYAGYLGMARQGNQTSGLNTGTSQWYVILDNSTTTEESLDGYYTVFGKVISGMSTVCAISKVPTYSSTNQPITPVFLKNITMISAASAPAPQPPVNCK